MYVIIWEFEPKDDSVHEFEAAYGPHGVWPALFRKGEGYIRTELLHDLSDARRYLTIDYWTSREAYDAFCKHRAGEYEAIDRRCESLTSREVYVGAFTTAQL
jgi:heme-degrading monooxygenase HmoA